MLQSKEGLGFVLDVVSHCQLAYGIKSGLRAGLFQKLLEGPKTCDELKKVFATSKEKTAALLNLLVSHSILEKTQDKYAVASEVKPYLDQNSKQYAGKGLEFLTAPFLSQAYENLETTFAKGLEIDTTAACHPVWEGYADHMGDLVRHTCKQVAQYVDQHLKTSKPLKVLDISASHGYYGIEMIKLMPKTHVFALDWENVLEKTKKNAHAAGFSEHFTFISGDAFRVDFPKELDLILLPAFLHHFSKASCQEMISKCFGALSKNGHLMVIDYMAQDQEVDRVAASFDFLMATTTGEGAVYKISEIMSMMEASGYAFIKEVLVSQLDQHVITGQKI